MADGNSITWRFAIGGADQARQDLASLGPAGVEAAKSLEAAFGKTDAQVNANIEHFRQLRDAAAQAATAANAANANVQTRVNQSVGVEQAPRPAQSSAAVFASQLAAYDKQAAQLRAQIDPLSAAQGKMNAAIATAGTLLHAGTITEVEHAAAVGLARKAYQDAEKAITSAGHATDGMSGKVREALVIMREFARGDFSRMAGSATIEAQRLGLLDLILSPLGITITAFTAAVIAAAVAEERWASSQQKIVAALQGTAAASGATLQEIDGIGEASAKSGQLSEAAGRQFALSFASAGVAASNLGQATGLVRDFAVATGQTAVKASEELAKAFGDPAKGAVELNNQLHFLTAAEIDSITHMQEHGDRAAALKELMDRLATATDNAALHQTGLGHAMQGVSVWFSNAADSIGKYISKLADLPEADGAARMAQLQRQRSALAAQGQGDFIGGTGGSELGGPSLNNQAALAKLDKEIAAEQRIIDQAKQRSDQAAASVASATLREATDDLNPQMAEIARKQAHIDVLKANLDKPDALKSNNMTRAQAVQDIADGEREVVELQKRSEHLDKHAQSLARDSAAMRENAVAALAAAAAYASGGLAAGGREESRQKAVTEATRRGVPVGQQVAEQDNLDAANAAKDSERSAAELRAETAALAARDVQIRAGTVSYKDAKQAEEDEAKLAPIRKAQNEGDAQSRAAATKALREQTAALAAQHAQERQDAALGVLAQDNEKGAGLDRQVQLSTLPKGSREHDDAMAQIEAENELRNKGVTDFTSQSSRDVFAAAIANAGKERQIAANQYGADTQQSQSDAAKSMQLQVSMIGQAAEKQALVLAVLKAEQDLRDHNVDAATAEGQAILAGAANAVRLNQALEQAKANYAEMKDTGEGFLDTIGSSLGHLDSGASAFADAWVSAFREVDEEAIKLALINPLKNDLFGESLPTLGSVSSFFSNFFGGPSASGSSFNFGSGGLSGGFDVSSYSAASTLGPLGFNALGTSSWRGGRTVVGEDGPEVVDLPMGSSIYNANRSQAMMATAVAPTVQSPSGSGPSGDVHVHNHGATPVGGATSSRNGDGSTRIDIYDKVGRPLLQSASHNGDLERAFRLMPDRRTKRP